MGIGVVLLALAAAQGESRADPMPYLAGTWISTFQPEAINAGGQAIAFSEGAVHWSTHREQILNAVQRDNMIEVETPMAGRYTIERIDQNAFCLVAREQPGSVTMGRMSYGFADGPELRPYVRDGLVTINCFRRLIS